MGWHTIQETRLQLQFFALAFTRYSAKEILIHFIVDTMLSLIVLRFFVWESFDVLLNDY